MRRQRVEPNRVDHLKQKRLTNVNGRSNDSSKALYYTLASSTVLEKTNFSGNTRELDNVFLAAAKYGDMDILLRTLDRHSININVRDEANGDTALLLAAKGNNSKVVEALVERGADVTLLNEDGKGALDLASNYLKLSVLSKYPKNPAHTGAAVIKAAWQGDIVSLRNLLATHSGSSVLDKPTEEGLTPLLVVTRDINSFLRLQRSIRLSYDPAKVIQELLKHKANVNATDMEGHTALHFATRISAQKLCREIVELLLLHRPIINILDRTNLAPLHTATNNDNVAVVSALVAAGANPNLHGIGGATPLHIGAQQENEDIVRKLVLAGGDVNALDSAGMTPLCVARSHKIRELMRSVFADITADKGMEVKLKYDELLSKRKLQKMLEPPPAPPTEPTDNMDTGKPDYKPLQRALINDAYRNKYDYDASKRVPRLVEGKRVTLDYSARRRSSDRSVVSLFPRIEPENPVLLLKRHDPIEMPIMQRQQSRLKTPNSNVFITQRQSSCQRKPHTDLPKTRPPIPKHTCGFVKPDRNGSGKTRKSDRDSNASGGGNNKTNDNDQWLPGAPIILAGSDSSRPTSAVTGSSSQSNNKGPKIHLKHVLKNILATSSGAHHENLLDRYVQQQRPIKVKEMGFVDFLLQDDDPEKMSEASSSIRSHNFSDSSSMSGLSVAGMADDALTASRVSVGETTPEMLPVNLPKLRQLPAPAPGQDQPLKASSKPVVERRGNIGKRRRGSLTGERRSSITRPHELVLRRNSNEDCRKMAVVTIASPYNSPSDNKISGRSSKDSGYGSLATLLNRSPPTEPEIGTPDDVPIKHVTAVVVNQESREESSGSETEGEREDEVTPRPSQGNNPVTVGEEGGKEEEREEKNISIAYTGAKEGEEEDQEEKNGPIVGVNGKDVLQLHGQRIKTVAKLSNNRMSKFKEQAFKKKVYSRRLPQIKEESRSRRGDSAVSRFKKREKRATKSARSATSESSGEKENTPTGNRPGTVPSKPVLGVNLTTKTKPRLKTSISDTKSEKSSPHEEEEDPDRISEDKIAAELQHITKKHDKTLLKRLSTMKDLDALVSTNPLQLTKTTTPQIEVVGTEVQEEAPYKFNDNRSLLSERRSVMTSFTGTTRIESIMGDTTQWKKGRLLGSGGGGKVWYGITQEKIEVAVKQIELYGEQEDTRDEYHELQEEVKLLKCLKHHNIIRYYGTCLQENRVNIFMEYIDGGSLASRIKKLGNLPERTIQNFTYQLLDALKYIHAKNIVHRDIKGQNILVTKDDQIKLIDFGCGKRLRRSMHNADALKTMRGTPYWMSPEVITGNGHGIKSDVWSLSCTVFEMLSGHPPWHSLPTMAAIYKIGTGRLPAYPDNASDYCIDFMKACFIVDTKERPSAEELLNHEFIVLFSNRLA